MNEQGSSSERGPSRQRSRPVLLVLSSTYPRWREDSEPGFVHELSKRMTGEFRVCALVPHAPGALRRETLDGVEIFRYRYAPTNWQTLVNNGGITTNLRRNRWKILLVPTFIFMQAGTAWRILRSERVDVIHAHWLVPQGLLAVLLCTLMRRKVPVVVTSHGADLFALRGKVLDSLKRFVIRKVAAATVVSAAMRDALCGLGADASKISVQPMGVDLQRRFHPDSTVQRSRNEILFVGRLVEKKGVRHLIEAMPTILSAHPAASLTIAGFGPEDRALRAQVAALRLDHKVTFLGAVQQRDLPELYRRAAVFVAPFVRTSSGDQEGLGLVLVEALGCGCPAIAGDVPAVADVPVKVVPVNANSLATVISEVLVAPEASAVSANKARAYCIQHFGWESVSQAYLDLLDECIGEKFDA